MSVLYLLTIDYFGPMKRLALIPLILACALNASSQSANTCATAAFDFDGDMQIGTLDLLGFLSVFGTDLDEDNDGVLDCEDPCSVSSSTCIANCGEELEYSGHSYGTALIGGRCWFTENLRTSTYRNGDLISSGLNDSEWNSANYGASVVFGEGSSLCLAESPDGDPCDESWSLDEYGRLYNWHVVEDARGLCPSGWHIPSDGEWTTMTDSLGGSIVAGYQMKTDYGWGDGGLTIGGYDGNGNNSSGFAGLPAGMRSPQGVFTGAGTVGAWWSSTLSMGSNVWARLLYASGGVERSAEYEGHGYSIRCIQDSDIAEGCTNPSGCNFDQLAVIDDGTCIFAEQYYNCDGTCIHDANGNGICDELESAEDFPCGDVMSYQGYDYTTVQIGEQCWFAENLRNENFQNGDFIPANLSDDNWTSTISGAAAIYGEGSSVCYPENEACEEAWSLAEYGRLYNWYAVDDVRSLCPSGWHVPGHLEWAKLEEYLGSQGFVFTEGAALKSTTGWIDNNNEDYGGTDNFGFSALPGGGRSSSGSFYSASWSGTWWSSFTYNNQALKIWLNDNSSINSIFDLDLNDGYSVRCVLDIPGCTNSSYLEYNDAANIDDGSCSTLALTCNNVEMDGHTYEAVVIGDQCWFAENLRTTRYSNGDMIPSGLDESEWNATTSGATAIVGEDGEDCFNGSIPGYEACDEVLSLEVYGRLYNWYAVDDERGLCPTGWHIPSDQEWTELEDYIGAELFAGLEGHALKSTSGWADVDGEWVGDPPIYIQDGNGSDYFGFSALPAGGRLGSYFTTGGVSTTWWTFTPYIGNAWVRRLTREDASIQRLDLPMETGRSVRCLKD